ncbi:aquaporin [bacterium]|nr:aquaporin [bacterium]
MKENFKKYLVEFIGTFFLMFTVGSVVLLGANGVIGAIAIGFALMIMVYAGGYVSGGHYNPAVSLAAAVSGALDKKQLLQYWVAQALGASAAALLVCFLSPEIIESSCPFSLPQIVIGEFLFTFALCYVVLQTAVAEKTAGNCYYGLAIGSTVMVGAVAVGGILCFGAFNPAVALGLGILNVACWVAMGITVATNLIAAVIAALTYKFINK